MLQLFPIARNKETVLTTMEKMVKLGVLEKRNNKTMINRWMNRLSNHRSQGRHMCRAVKVDFYYLRKLKILVMIMGQAVYIQKLQLRILIDIKII
jgi:hypothetical protein